MKKTVFYLVLSAFFLALAFRSVGLWGLGFLALAPYFCFIYSKRNFSLKQIFLGGFVFGTAFSFFINIQVLFSYFLVWFPGVLACGIMIGLVGVVCKKLEKYNLWDIFIFASIWVLGEWIRQFLFQYFDYTTLAYTAYALTPLLSVASIGGIYFVSFIISSTNAFIGYLWLHGKSKKLGGVFFMFIITLISIYFLNQWYLNSGNMSGHEVSFSNIQLQENFWPYASTSTEGTLVLNDQTENLIQEAVAKKADYVIYPENLVQYIISDNPTAANVSATFDQVNTALKNIIPQNQKFIFWTDTKRAAEGNYVSDETDTWENGDIIGLYQKRNIHPFYDLTNAYFREHGIFNKPYYYQPSSVNRLVYVDGENFGNISCSELNYSFLARRDVGMGANIILSLGYASVFEYPILGQMDIPIAQLRAAETNVPLVRSDVRGPSVFVDKTGSIVTETGDNQDSISVVKLFVQTTPRKTIYVLCGDYLFIGALFVFLFFCAYRRIK